VQVHGEHAFAVARGRVARPWPVAQHGAKDVSVFELIYLL
jgi:hypothetical protein